MGIAVQTPTTEELGSVVAALASWQREGHPVQLHPGDLGSQWRLGADAVAGSLCVWRRDEDDEIVAIGFREAFRSLLSARGWVPDEPWTSLRRTLAEPVPAACASRPSGPATSRTGWRCSGRRSRDPPSQPTGGTRWRPGSPTGRGGAQRRRTPPKRGSSSATVATPSANLGAVATYEAAGFDADPEVTDFRRPA